MLSDMMEGKDKQDQTQSHTPGPTTMCQPSPEPGDAAWYKTLADERVERWKKLVGMADASNSAELREYIKKAEQSDWPKFKATLGGLLTSSKCPGCGHHILDGIWDNVSAAERHVLEALGMASHI